MCIQRLCPFHSSSLRYGWSMNKIDDWDEITSVDEFAGLTMEEMCKIDSIEHAIEVEETDVTKDS